MNSRTLVNLLTLSFVWFATATGANTQDGLTQGDAVIDAVDHHEDGYQNLQSNVTMVLENASGRKRERHLDVYSLELTPLGDRRKFIFNRPADINGTAILIHSNVVESDDHWIYLPAFNRVKRIASSNKSTPFVGSEYSYEDLSSQEKEKYANRYIEDTMVGDRPCKVVERIPKFAHSAYSKLLAYIDIEKNRYRKVEYFDKQGQHLKTQHLEDYKLFDDRYLLPTRTVMINHATNKTTSMLWRDIQLKMGHKDKEFTTAALKRAH